MIMEMIKEDYTLSALNIQMKLIEKGVNVSASTIRRTLKLRKYTYKNIAIMILTSNHIKTKKIVLDKYLEEDRSKYIFAE